MSKILRLNMTTKTSQWQEVPPAYQTLGGRALTSRLIRDEVPPTCHPLSAANILVARPGPAHRHQCRQFRTYLRGRQIAPHRRYQRKQLRGDSLPKTGPPGHQGGGGGRAASRGSFLSLKFPQRRRVSPGHGIRRFGNL